MLDSRELRMSGRDYRVDSEYIRSDLCDRMNISVINDDTESCGGRERRSIIDRNGRVTDRGRHIESALTVMSPSLSREWLSSHVILSQPGHPFPGNTASASTADGVRHLQGISIGRGHNRREGSCRPESSSRTSGLDVVAGHEDALDVARRID